MLGILPRCSDTLSLAAHVFIFTSSMRTNSGIQIAALRLEWLRRVIDGFDDGGVQSKSIRCSFSPH